MQERIYYDRENFPISDKKYKQEIMLKERQVEINGNEIRVFHKSYIIFPNEGLIDNNCWTHLAELRR